MDGGEPLQESASVRRASGAAPVRQIQGLDSLRGIAAMLVALFHFRISGHVMESPLVRNGWIFVDFFFVLSGFVICHAYGDRLAARTVSVGRFMALRMGRIYPLHFAVLMAWLAFELLKLAAGKGGAAFTGDYDPLTLLYNILLLQSFGLQDSLGWNQPAWSIAAEMWVYLLFAVLLAIFSDRGRWIFVLLGGGALIWLVIASPRALDATFDLGFVRCVFGFSLGLVVHAIYARWPMPRQWPLATFAEALLAGAAIGFVWFFGSGWPTFFAPFLFAAVVLVFAMERGAICRWLCWTPLVWLGQLSYSIYMVHALVEVRLAGLLKRFGGALGISQVGTGEHDQMWKAAPLLGDFLGLLVLLVVVATSFISYRLIELPAREWTRRRLIGLGIKRRND